MTPPRHGLAPVPREADRAPMAAHPVKPGVLGLRIVGEHGWTATLRDGERRPIAPGRNVPLAVGVRVAFDAGLDGLVAAQD